MIMPNTNLSRTLAHEAFEPVAVPITRSGERPAQQGGLVDRRRLPADAADLVILESRRKPGEPTEEERTHFWAAQRGGEIVGIVGVVVDRPNVASLRRQRFDPAAFTESVERRLLEQALELCRSRGFLKLVLDTVDDVTLTVATQLGYHHSRTRTLNGRTMAEFYLDLYHQPSKS